MEKNQLVTVVNADFKAADEIYNVAREQADLELAELTEKLAGTQGVGFALGFIGAQKMQRKFSDFADALMFYRMKQTKDYKKAGLTWDQFCEKADYERKTVDRILEDVTPVIEAFSDNLSVFVGFGINDVRYLGKNFSNFSDFVLSEDGKSFIIDGQTIPATPAEFGAFIKTQRAQIEETGAALAAKDKVLADKEKLINKYAKDLSRLEGKLKTQEITPAEAGFLKEMDNLRTSFDGHLLMLDPERVANLKEINGDDLTPRMRAAYLSSLDYMRKQILMAFDRGEIIFGSAVMCPEAAGQVEQ